MVGDFRGSNPTSAIIVLMTAFGSAIGLSLVLTLSGPSPIILHCARALVYLDHGLQLVAGGYVTGRMRRPIDGPRP